MPFMASRQSQAVSKPLLILLLIVAVIGVIMFVRGMGPAPDENAKFEGVPEVPKDLKPPELPANGPRPTTGG